MLHSKVVVLALMVLVVPLASASIEVSPGSYSFEGVAGDSFTQEVTVSYSGSSVFAGHLVSNVVAEDTNSTGVSVSYSGNGFVLYPGDSTEVIIRVDTVTALKPDNFTVTSRVKGADLAEDKASIDRDVTRVVEKIVEDEGNKELNETIQDLKKKLEEKKDRLNKLNSTVEGYSRELSEAREEITKLQRLVEKLNSTAGNETGKISEPDPSKESFNWTNFFATVFLGGLAFLSGMYISKRLDK